MPQYYKWEYNKREDVSKPTTRDPFWDRVDVLIDFVGADAVTDFSDIGVGGHLWTAVGTAQILSGALDLPGAGSHVAHTFDSGEFFEYLHNGSSFTLEMKVAPHNVGAVGMIISNGGTDPTRRGFYIDVTAAGKLQAGISTGSQYLFQITSERTLGVNTMYDIALVMNNQNKTGKLFINGRLEAEARWATTPDTYDGDWLANAGLRLGSDPATGTGTDFNGRISQLRITKAARYFDDYDFPENYLTEYLDHRVATAAVFGTVQDLYLSPDGRTVRDNTANNGWAIGDKTYTSGDSFAVEFTIVEFTNTQDIYVGIAETSTVTTTGDLRYTWRGNGSFFEFNATPGSGRDTFKLGDVVTLIHRAGGNIWIGINGAWEGDGDPVAGTSPTHTATGKTSLRAHVITDNSATNPVVRMNAGQEPFRFVPPDQPFSDGML
jgi:hypothetical protein